MKRIGIFLCSPALFLLSASAMHAADFHALPAAGNYKLKSQITVDVRIDTSGETMNAAQATLTFNPALLEATSISTTGSVFNFWLQEPVFSNTDGTIRFIGGTVNGVSGSSLQIIQIVFTAKGIGTSEFTFSDAAITAADNTGTNILANTNGAAYTVATGSSVPIAPVATPVQIIRPSVAASGAPTLPEVNIPLYPNSDNWYGVAAPFAASWVLPPDISGIRTALNTDPRFVPPTGSEGLFESKTFPAVNGDGIYYLHVRFQNSKGWGPTLHHRIAVDSQPPMPFETDVKTGLLGDVPSPVLSFGTTDALSGISRYELFVNAEAAIIASDSTVTLSPRPPGTYRIRVRAVDKAGNGIEDRVQVEIVPIESPIINAINRRVIVGTDEFLDIRGSAIPNASVVVTITEENGRFVLRDESRVDAQGAWEYRLDKELRLGDYLVSVRARDARGALSLPTDPVKISFVEKPVLSLFGWDITLRLLIIMLVIASIIVTLVVLRARILRMARSQRGAVIISRDLRNAFDAVKKDLDMMADTGKKRAPIGVRELQLDATSKKIRDSLDKIDKYLAKDIEKLG